MLLFPSFLIAFAGALFAAVAPRRLMILGSILFPAMLLGHIIVMWGEAFTYSTTLAGLSLSLVGESATSAGSNASFFLLALGIVAVAGGIYQCRSINRAEQVASFIYIGSAIGVILTGNLLVMLVLWEMMALASSMIIFARRSSESGPAALRYLYMHMLGGILLMAGIAGHVFITGSMEMTAIPGGSEILRQLYHYDLHSMSLWLMLLGILLNTAAIPFSAWLTDAYPKASVFGTVFLSAVTTKTAIFVLATLFPGAPYLISLGIATAAYGVVYALMQHDLRKMYAYSIVSQVGLMIVGIGIGTPMALAAVSVHAFSHIMYKSLLMMSAGAVLHIRHRVTFDEIRGLHRTMPWAAAGLLIGGLALSAAPLTLGFISKSGLSTVIAHYGNPWLWYGFVALSAGTFLYSVMRIAVVMFSKHSSPSAANNEPSPIKTTTYPIPMHIKIPIIVLCVICIALGMPGVSSSFISVVAGSELLKSPFSAVKIINQLELLLASGVAYFIMHRYVHALEKGETLDIDALYRALPMRFISLLSNVIITPIKQRVVSLTKGTSKRLFSFITQSSASEILTARHWEIGTTATLMLALLGCYLAFYYV